MTARIARSSKNVPANPFSGAALLARLVEENSPAPVAKVRKARAPRISKVAAEAGKAKVARMAAAEAAEAAAAVEVAPVEAAKPAKVPAAQCSTWIAKRERQCNVRTHNASGICRDHSDMIEAAALGVTVNQMLGRV